ncbi:hypothetical protein DSO57_1039193 [Entomophthora muscae]|uniref:Uncharacterized protein n=1 Tax=Entomophthora muscae TaxID=34485 RepID=A0ACC2SYL3_9FUNG|nr:hypothetical protein DSO57_1039193 [Entomophthora muscae]
MESSIGLEGVAPDLMSSFGFDVSRFNLDDFENLSIHEVSPEQKQVDISCPEQAAELKGDAFSKEVGDSMEVAQSSLDSPAETTKRAFVSDDSVNVTVNKPNLTVLVNENKKPKKGILKPSSPPENFAARSSTIFRQHKEKILERISLLNRGSAYIDFNDPSLKQELHPRELKRVRFSFPLGSTSFILPNSCKITSPTSTQLTGNSSIISPEGPSCQLSVRDTIEWYRSLCHSREEMPNARFIQLLEEAENTQQRIDSINMSGESLSMRNIISFADGIDLLNGLTRLELEDCGLDNDCIKVLCSNFLQTDRLLWLSLANNPKIRSEGFRFIATYINQSKQLKFLDLSCNIIDVKAAKFLARGVMAPLLLLPLEEVGEVSTPTSASLMENPFAEPSCCLEELRLNECSLHLNELKIICQGLSRSNLKSLSLCGNKISHLGAAALVSLLTGSKGESSQLVILDLSMNHLKSSGLEQLLLPLSDPQVRLEELNLGRNGISELGMAKLFAALVRFQLTGAKV